MKLIYFLTYHFALKEKWKETSNIAAFDLIIDI